VVAVGFVEQRVDLEDQLTDVDVRRQLLAAVRRAEVGLEQLVPAREHRADAVSDRPAAAVELGGGGREAAATREHAALEVRQVALAQLLQALQPFRGLHRRLDDLGGIDRLGGDAADGEALEPFESGEPGGRVEDRAVAALAVGAGAPCACG
jgi:hypothetical protein